MKINYTFKKREEPRPGEWWLFETEYFGKNPYRIIEEHPTHKDIWNVESRDGRIYSFFKNKAKSLLY